MIEELLYIYLALPEMNQTDKKILTVKCLYDVISSVVVWGHLAPGPLYCM